MNRAVAIGQRWRLVILFAYLALLIGTSWFAFGTPMPAANQQGIWFYSGGAAILLGSLLLSPYFTKPADAVANAVAALLVLVPVSPWTHVYAVPVEIAAWWSSAAFVSVVLASAIVAILLKDSEIDARRKVAASATLFVDPAGSARALFSVVYFFAVFAFHRNSAGELVAVGFAWVVCVGLRPLETTADVVRRWKVTWAAGHPVLLGVVVGHEAPGVVVFRASTMPAPAFGSLVLARTSDMAVAPAFVLDAVGYADGVWLRALELRDHRQRSMDEGEVGALARAGQVLRYDTGAASGALQALAKAMNGRLIGLVSPDSDIGHIEVELARSDLPISEGSLLEAAVRESPVLYQVTRGVTREELLEQKNRRGFVRARARRIGTWSAEDARLVPSQWLPEPNTPVYLSPVEDGTASVEAIGRLPGTPYHVSLDIDSTVTHNTAILGVLGIGKSFLAMELVERMIASNIKVICLDLTDEYGRPDRLGSFIDDAQAARWDDRLAQVGPRGKAKVRKNVEEGGSIREFAVEVRAQLTEFLDPNCPAPIRLVNPGRLEVWRQDSRPFQDTASMATLSPTEVVRVFTQEALGVLQAQGVSEHAKVCIVLEEAHSLVPEFNSVAFEGDKEATNGTAKALLQGRKYGLGCLLVTQRTANVTKTVLSQCNTVISLRMFDSTAIDYLSHFVGEETARLVPELPDRVAIVFGRASSCSDPVLVRLNDRDDFIRTFRGLPDLPPDAPDLPPDAPDLPPDAPDLPPDAPDAR